MADIYEQKCKNCGAMLRFDPVSGKLVCGYCGSKTDIEEKKTDPQIRPKAKKKKHSEQHSMEGFNFESLLTKAECKNARKLPVYSCISCGAEILAADETFALSCPYCQNNLVLTDKISGNLRPDGIIPFSITPDSLPDAVKSFYRDKKLLPRTFFTDTTMGKVTGIYVPFWVFDGTAKGSMIYTGEREVNSKRKGDYLYFDHSVYELKRRVSLSFSGVPVDASEKMSDALMDSIEPFDMSGVKSFDLSYLAGFAADRFDVPAKNIASRAERRMCNTVGSLAMKKGCEGYTNVKHMSSRLSASLTAKYILMPVYQFDLSFKGKKYNYVVNGQTGKVVGELPFDKKEKKRFFLLRFFAYSAAMLGFFVVKYFLGG